MTELAKEADPTEAVGGSYEVLKNRLAEQGRELASKADELNERRKKIFGGTELTVIGNERIRTENNCVPAEILSIGDLLLFGYSVHMGLKEKADVSDVLSLHKFAQSEDGFSFEQVGSNQAGGFLEDRRFVRELEDLYRYYEDPWLLQLQTTSDAKLLAVFRVGKSQDSVRVFRWNLDPDGRAYYQDNRGESNYTFPPSHDFSWIATTRDNQVQGKHPHLSILDEVFVETIEGDLTIKIEDNTEDGKGIYNEPVQEENQSLDDAEVHYAKVGGLILLKILPYREDKWRYFVFNTRTQDVVRIDSIGRACVQLPEDHGIIFPGGFYLQTGVYKLFEGETENLNFQTTIKSPNGEDVLYVFLTRGDGNYLLFPYNVIRKDVQNPIPCHGYTLFADGKMVLFKAVSDDPTRVHPMQIWQTPFTSAEFAASAPTDGSFLAKVGNADLVRGISDSLSIKRLTDNQSIARHIYEDLIGISKKTLDSYYWLNHPEVDDMASTIKEIRKTAELIIDEFEKVQALQEKARNALQETKDKQRDIVLGLKPDDWHDIDRFMAALSDLRKQRGHLITLRDMRFMDLDVIDALEQEAIEQFDRVSLGCSRFLLTDEAFTPLKNQLEETLGKISTISKTTEAEPLSQEVTRISEGLTILSDVAGGLQVEDPTARTTILEGISEVFAQVNRVRATLEVKRKELLGKEGRAEFAAQFKLLGQSVENAIARSSTPEACDDQLSNLMLQLEEVESKFSEFDEFLGDLAAKREEIYETFSTKKQMLLEERQRRGQNLFTAAERILTGITRRAKSFKTPDELNTYYASDPMLIKIRELAERLRDLGDTVKADEIESQVKGSKQDALRLLRDRTELFDEGENLIKFGRHRFSVNTQPVELTMLPRDSGMAFHLTGTDYYASVEDESFNQTKDLWDQSLISENSDVYRGEYLAASLLFDAETGSNGLTLKTLHDSMLDEGQGLLEFVRKYASDRYDEGYERGVHDSDASLILEKLMALRQSAGLLRFAPDARALACFYWSCLKDADKKGLYQRKAQNLGRLRTSFHFSKAIGEFADGFSVEIDEFRQASAFPGATSVSSMAAGYLIEELMAESGPVFSTSSEAIRLKEGLIDKLDSDMVRANFEDDLRSLRDQPYESFRLALAWIDAFLAHASEELLRALSHARTEAAVTLITDQIIERNIVSAVSSVAIDGLLGQHSRIKNGSLELRLDEFLSRLSHHINSVVPRYKSYRETRAQLIVEERERLRIDEFKPRVLTSFVRNKLINEVYLPLIGDNLAKQLGSSGEGKRTDLMGMLLLVSPPGYGKTTLMEYLANQLGLVFMKVNGPSLGHSVTSLDPSESPNATAKQEVNKINLSFEMANNVMLYLDDIQHTNPELLQKFISLCDAQRRIEGVWNGKTRTYDLRGKKFCIVMAGNPYTESGERFQIPDMLANRADTYNLGDILEGKDHLFALSYIENAITSNPSLAPLASRSQNDLYVLVRMAQGEEVPMTEFSYPYSSAEISEMIAVLKHLFAVQQTLLKVNAQYIASAAQDDAYRTEPRFQLQGSYRNMTKLAEKVVSALNEEELQRLINDHYLGEAQTLTSGAEHNLLKLAEIRGILDEQQKQRWDEIRSGFQRQKRLGGSDDDPTIRVIGQLGDIAERIDGIRQGVLTASEKTLSGTADNQALNETLVKLDRAIDTLKRPQVEVNVDSAIPKPVQSLLDQQISLVEGVIRLVYSTTRSLEEGGSIHAQLIAVLNDVKGASEKIRSLEVDVPQGQEKG